MDSPLNSGIQTDPLKTKIDNLRTLCYIISARLKLHPPSSILAPIGVFLLLLNTKSSVEQGKRLHFASYISFVSLMFVFSLFFFLNTHEIPVDYFSVGGTVLFCVLVQTKVLC